MSASATMTAVQPYLDDYHTLAADASPGEPAWAAEARRAAIARFERLGFPTPRNEDWHFTSVAPIAESEFRTLASPGGNVTAADVAAFGFGAHDWPTLVFVNGRHAPELSRAHALPAGVRLLDLDAAWREVPELLSQHLTKLTATSGQDNAFTALNTAFLREGGVVHVAAGVAADRPLHLLYITDAEAAKTVTHPRNLIVAERHASVTVVESYVALGSAHYFTNAVTEVRVADGATVRHYKVQRESERAFHVGTIEADQGRDSHYVSFSFATGAALSRTNVYAVLDGPGCGATLDGLYMVGGEQHVDHQTRIEHVEPNCFSREVYKGVLDGASHGVFNGKVYVHPEAQKTDGKQTNKNLLLSDRARVDTKPQLEIFADDVKCTHGATIGRIDETALFYMKSRGVSAETARRLLTYAFAADVLEQIEVPEVRESLEALALRRFTAGE